MQKKVGIITLNGGENYGNVLQNYAVQEIVNELGCNAETIKNTTRFGRFYIREEKGNKFTFKYIKQYILNQLNYRYNIKNSCDGIIKTLLFCHKNKTLLNSARKARKEVFAAFCNNYINWCKNTIDINKIWNREQIEQFDFFISGSDQVWNPTYPSVSSINFLQFAPEHKRITFSPSFGINQIPEQFKADYSKWLQGIPYLSVREEQGREIIKELTGRDAKVLCDPTMLLSKEDWLKVAKKPEFNLEEKYILTYFLGDKNKEYNRFINQIVKMHNLKVINLFDVLSPEYYNVGPCEFLYLINNAELVCTDSFHGTVFSILMNTNFVTFSRIEDGHSMGSRISTLLKTFQLENRDFRCINNDKLFSIDFCNVLDILNTKKSEAIEFLKCAFESKKMESIEIETTSVIEDITKCCGCSACANVCPTGCISMESNQEGFKYPKIDKEKCIGCNKCESVCPVVNKTFPERSVGNKCYISYSLNSSVRKKSSSGGVFYHIAENVIKQGGVVFGVCLDKDNKVIHSFAETQAELQKFMGSKYVQSEIGDCYKKAKEFLKEGRFVLFSGTPCQIKGLYADLDKQYDNLITQDLICHGVPSPLVWDKYILFRNPLSNAEISFRDKTQGWHYFSMLIKDGKKFYRKNLDEDWYLKLFLDNTILRPSCYNCSAKEQGSSADITLADCWKPKSVYDSIKDTDEGLSLVLANSDKGSEFLNNPDLQKALYLQEVDSNKALASQTAISKSAPCNPKRAIFFEALNKCDFEYLYKHWYKKLFFTNLKKLIGYYKFKLKN